MKTKMLAYKTNPGFRSGKMKIIGFFFLLVLLLNSSFLTGQKSPDNEFRLKSRSNNSYLHTENGKPEMIADVPRAWWSAKWVLERVPATDFFRLKCKWKDTYLHTESGKPEIKANISEEWWSAMWELDEVVGTDYVLLKCRWKDMYLHVENGKLQLTPNIPENRFSALWKLESTDRLSDLRTTSFKPAVHGFQFKNSFKSTVGDAGSVKLEFNGLCGGMSYAVNDYFLRNEKVPAQNFQPAIGTPLHSYIYERQQNSFSNLDKFIEFTFNPFGARDREFFYWGLEGRLYDLKNSIDNNKPIPLGLFNVHNDPSSHHQVLALGYDLGGYSGKKEKDPHEKNVKIFIYDPNYPNKTCMLVPVPNEASYHQYVGDLVGGIFVENFKSSKKWRSYFVDMRYKKRNPPKIEAPNTKEGEKVNRLIFEIATGADDLRGGNDNVHFHITFKDGRTQSILNANRKHRWPDNHVQNVEVYLDEPVDILNITEIKLQTTFGGGMFGDNWNMDGILIKAIKGNGAESSFFSKNGSPLKRFTGDNQWYHITANDLNP